MLCWWLSKKVAGILRQRKTSLPSTAHGNDGMQRSWYKERMKTTRTSTRMVKRTLQDGPLGFLRKIQALDEGSDWTNF